MAAVRMSIVLPGIVAAALILPSFANAQSAGRSVPAEDTAAAVVDPDWEAPRTSWGHPSLEGIWSTNDMRSVPRERPDEFGLRQRLTDEEFAARVASDNAELDTTVNEQAFSGRREAGIRTFGFTSVVVDPPDGKYPELTEFGRERAATRNRGTFGPGPFDDFDDFNLYDRCITRGIFSAILPAIYGNGIRIAQGPGKFAITYEMIHETRIVPLDDRAHISDDIRPYLGNSRGHWEGDTLIVETRNFTDKTRVGVGGPHSDQLTVTETFRRTDPEMIEYTATVNDPVSFTAPFTYRVVFSTMPNGYDLYEYSCHEGNGAIDHSLSGERDYERRVEEAIANGTPIPVRTPGATNLNLPEGTELVYRDINAGE